MKKFAAKFLVGTMSLAVAMGFAITADAAAKKVTVSAPYTKTAEVAKGKKVTLKANQKVTYEVKNKKIASVTAKGVVKGKKAGTTKVTVTSKKNKKKKTTVTVKVMKAAVKKVKLNSGAFSLSVKGKKTLKATVTPGNASKKVVWKSSNNKVATVSDKGVVQGKKEGSAKITATATDGSKKKATVKVTVGAGIASFSVPHNRILEVKLSGAKALKASDFKIQNKVGPDTAYNTTEVVEKVSTTDKKSYTVLLESDSAIWENSYVKVTINALAGEKTKEMYISKIADYGDAGNTQVEYVASEVGNICNRSMWISNTNSKGEINVTKIDGTLPGGVTAKISKRGDCVNFAGRYNKVENGTTVTLTGVDQLGKTYTQKIVFYVGDENTIVGTVVPRTRLAYVPDDPKTYEPDSSGDDPWDIFMEPGTVVVAGADYTTTSYDYNPSMVTGLPEGVFVKREDEDSSWWSTDRTKAVPANTYALTLNITRYNDKDKEVKASIPFTVNVVNGVTVTGTVTDAAGQPARYIDVYGATKRDENGIRNNFYSETDGNGKYTVRVLPGDYYTQVEENGRDCDLTIGNNFTANATKNFVLPMYRVDFTTTVPGANAYDLWNYNPNLMDEYGRTCYMRAVNISIDPNKGKLYAYLAPGTYSMLPVSSEEDAYRVDAYKEAKKREGILEDGVTKYDWYALTSEEDNFIGEFKLSLNAPFTVAGNMSVVLTATPYQRPVQPVEQ